MKRFTETDKWRDPWFRKLSSPAKQLYGYLLDHCDKIGFVEIDFTLASADCGQKITQTNLVELGDRIQDCGAGKYFLPKFINFQYGKLSPDCPPHRPIIELIAIHRLQKTGLHYYYPNATLPLGYRTRQEEEKEEDKDKKGSEDIKTVLKPFPSQLSTARVSDLWLKWVNHRKSLKKPKDWNALFNEQIDFLSVYTEQEVFEILQKSVMNGYQGLFPPSNHANGTKTHQRSTENPRNIGIIRGPTDYAAAAKRKQEAQAQRDGQTSVAGQVGEAETSPPSNPQA